MESTFNKLSIHNCVWGGAVVQWLSLLHNFIQQSLNSGSAQVQILLVACRRVSIVPAWNKAKRL